MKIFSMSLFDRIVYVIQLPVESERMAWVENTNTHQAGFLVARSSRPLRPMVAAMIADANPLPMEGNAVRRNLPLALEQQDIGE